MATEAEKLYKDQQKTFTSMMNVMKYSSIAIAITLVLMYFFLVA